MNYIKNIHITMEDGKTIIFQPRFESNGLDFDPEFLFNGSDEVAMELSVYTDALTRDPNERQQPIPRRAYFAIKGSIATDRIIMS